MKWIAGLSATSAALAYVGIPIEYKKIAIAGLGVTVMLMALYNVLRYGPLVKGIERRAMMRATTKAQHTHRAAPRHVETPVVPPSIQEEQVDEEVENYHRIAISRSTTARPPRVRRAVSVRRTPEQNAPALVTMLPVEEGVAADDMPHA
jgi:hypothetical protein